MRIITIAIFGLLSLASVAQPIFVADTAAIDVRARAAVADQHPDIHVESLTLKRMSWWKHFDNKSQAQSPPIAITYFLEGSQVTNMVGQVALAKHVEVTVTMNEDGTIPGGKGSVSTSVVTQSVSPDLPPQGEGRAMIKLKYDNAPLEEILNFYSSLKDVPVVQDTRIHTAITCVSSTRLSEQEAASFIEAVLAEKGIILVKRSDGALHVVEKSKPSDLPETKRDQK